MARPDPCWESRGVAPFALPGGLVDAHVHLTFEARDRLGLPRGSAELIAAHLDLQRRAGVLAVRDAGSLPGVALDDPRVVGCGPFLAPPDFFLPHLYEGTPASAAPEAAARRVRDGWPWVKVIGDYPGADGNPLNARPGYPPAVLAEIAAATHEAGGRLAVHVMGAFVDEAIAAGADSIEHGNLADEDAVREMAARGTAWTPTLTTVLHHLEPIAERHAPAAAVLDGLRRTLPLAAELGVTLLAGTDEQPHGSIAEEVAALVRYGVPTDAALAAASTAARTYLGLPESDEVVVFAADPREDPAVLAAPVAVESRA
jgi:imidazolonepropionase-like amidohydrolase